MELNHLLDHFDTEAGQKEEVALIIYFLEKGEGYDSVDISDVKETISSSKSGVPISSVSTYIRRLKKYGWLSECNGESFLLHHDGEDQVEALLDNKAFDSPRPEHEKFIDSEIFEEPRYSSLVEDINKSYRYRIYDGTMVLTRKFFENLVFEILREEYAGENVQMFFDQENQRHFNFDELLNNLKLGVPNLKRFTKEGLDREMVESVRNLKDKGNKGAHSIRVEFEDGEIEGLSEDATHFAEVLYEIWAGVQNANNSE